MQKIDKNSVFITATTGSVTGKYTETQLYRGNVYKCISIETFSASGEVKNVDFIAKMLDKYVAGSPDGIGRITTSNTHYFRKAYKNEEKLCKHL